MEIRRNKNLRSAHSGWLYDLFLFISFPVHGWSIYKIFINIQWIAERTNWNDSLGYAAYSLVFAFLETIVITIVFIPFYFWFVKKRSEQQAIAQVSALFLGVITSKFLLESMSRVLTNTEIFDNFIVIIVSTNNLLFQILIVLIIIIFCITPIYIFYSLGRSSQKFIKSINQFINRLQPLINFYLILDFLGFLIVVIRNIKGA